jgi:putative flippase GtrA
MTDFLSRYISLLPLGKYRQTYEEFVRFGLVGATNTVIDFGVYIVLTRGFAFWEKHFIIANAIAFAVAVLTSFLLNNFWTFNKNKQHLAGRGAKFLTVVAIALLWNSTILYVLTLLGYHDLLAKLVAVAVVGVWNFTLYKFWVFGG